jgi:hypothetical protein
LIFLEKLILHKMKQNPNLNDDMYTSWCVTIEVSHIFGLLSIGYYILLYYINYYIILYLGLISIKQHLLSTEACFLFGWGDCYLESQNTRSQSFWMVMSCSTLFKNIFSSLFGGHLEGWYLITFCFYILIQEFWRCILKRMFLGFLGL